MNSRDLDSSILSRWMIHRESRARASVVWMLAWCVAWISLAGCESPQKESDSSSPRVILVALDGATWTVLDRLMGDGKLPNLARMKVEGAAGTLRSEEPIFSPVLWTTIATGKTPAEHGIESFTVPVDGEPTPVTSNLVRTPRLWEILSSRNRSVGVIGWWTTWPATRVQGFLCSERTWPLALSKHGMPTTSEGASTLSWRTWPENLMETVEPLIVIRDNLTASHIAEVDVRGTLGTVGSRGPCVADVYAKDITFMAVAESLYPAVRPDFFTIYLEITDVMAHYFWEYWRYHRFLRYSEPTEFDSPPQEQDAETAAYIGENFERGYEYADRAIGRILAMADDSTLVMVVSDHGYGENTERARLHIGDGIYARNSHWHLLDGVLLAWGRGVAKGVELEPASVLDIAPTVLYAMGEPSGADMPGRILTDLFEDSLRGRDFGTVSSYDSLVTGGSQQAVTSDEDESYRELLRSLGYIN